MNQRLLDVLKKVKKKVEIYTSVDGTSVLVLPYGGRILGLFAPNSEKNFYWTNPVLNDVSKAEAFFAGDQWQNTLSLHDALPISVAKHRRRPHLAGA
jgi:hypothetical protein